MNTQNIPIKLSEEVLALIKDLDLMLVNYYKEEE